MAGVSLVSLSLATSSALAQTVTTPAESDSFQLFLSLIQNSDTPKALEAEKVEDAKNLKDDKADKSQNAGKDRDKEAKDLDGEKAGEADADKPAVDASDEAKLNEPLGETLALADVMASLYRSYPEILRAQQQRRLASGELLSTYGEYDTKLQAYSLNEPLGFYKNYRSGIGVARQTWWGGYLSAGYRLGRGSVQPWYKERQTDEGGEFKLALTQPLLQGRAIDAQRVAVFQASLAQQAVAPIIQQAILDTSRDAASVYWQWVAAGAVLKAQQELLELAVARGEQYEVGVKAGKFAEIDLLLNQQLIAERQAKLLETEQKFRSTAFKLSLYLRDGNGQPMPPNDAWLPKRFPVIEPLNNNDFQSDLAAALDRRPEPRILQIERRQVFQEQQLACNQLLPQLDLVAEASQDVGEPATSSNDKGEFELLIGVTGEIPIQRRKARGKIQSTSAKMAQISEKQRLVENKIAVELQTAYNALQLTSQVVEQTRLSLTASLETLSRYRFAFDKGKIDLIYLNLLESKANEIEIKLVESQQNWFSALTDMQIALGLDPLDQALIIAELPSSELPSPGNLPEQKEAKPDDLLRDWDRHSKVK